MREIRKNEEKKREKEKREKSGKFWKWGKERDTTVASEARDGEPRDLLNCAAGSLVKKHLSIHAHVLGVNRNTRGS